MTTTHYDTPILEAMLENSVFEDLPLPPPRTHEEFLRDTGYTEWHKTIGDAREDAPPITPGDTS